MLVLASDLPSGLGEADVINGLALLSVLINASYGGWVGLLPRRVHEPSAQQAPGSAHPTRSKQCCPLIKGQATAVVACDV